MRQLQARNLSFSMLFIAALVLFSAWSGGAVLAAEGYTGVYAGGHETVGMGATVSYTYSLELKEDAAYEIKSYFIMGDALYELIETGTYTVDGSKLVITPEGQDPVEGSFNDDGTVTISVKPSMMARERTEATLVRSNIAAAGVYTATLQGPVVVEATLYLNHQGQYHYMAVPDNDSPAFHEQGLYSVAGDEITFQIADSGESFTGKVSEDTVSAPFVVSAMMGMRIEIELSK
jgi:hypothetical protein